MKLKTSRDIIWELMQDTKLRSLVRIELQFKQELIKWVKATHKIAMNNLDSPLPIHFEGMVFNKDTIFGARIILMKIFDITEEDLK